ncbi:MAG: CoA pyrophosphatase [Halobacteriaceae archaeon]
MDERGGEPEPGGGSRPARLDLDRLRNHDPVAVEDHDSRREAAVLIPVVERPEGHALVVVRRADHLGEHAGEMAFPGGGREPTDVDLHGTALREAGEEVGLRPVEATVLGRLDDIRTVSAYVVRPFVATVPDRTYEPDDREVVEVVTLPVSALTDPENYDRERRDHPDRGEVTLHYFRVDGYTVWGATGRLLAQLLAVGADWQPPPDRDD